MSNNSSEADSASDPKMSRRNFLKLIGAAGAAITLSPLIRIGKVFGATTANSTNSNATLVGGDKVGLDGVSFLYPSKPGGFVWYMNNNKPFDLPFERGGGSSYSKLVKNKDGSRTTDDHKKVEFNLSVDPSALWTLYSGYF